MLGAQDLLRHEHGEQVRRLGHRRGCGLPRNWDGHGPLVGIIGAASGCVNSTEVRRGALFGQGAVGRAGCKLTAMARHPSGEDTGPIRPDIDENGVDRAQIRAMLALTPEERLRRIEEFVDSALEIRELNAPRTLDEMKRRP